VNFWDSSAILPLLVSETSTPAVRALYDGEPEIAAWWGTPAECVSALARLEREGALDAASVAAAIRELGALAEQWHEVQPVEAVRRTAMRLLRVHNLRAADSLQLAAALTAAEGNPESLPFVCLDQRLSLAAEREGCRVLGSG
jgi:predicted nucleic acid-binding protein